MNKLIRNRFTKLDKDVGAHPVSGEPSRVKQEPRDQVDINAIWARAKKGILPPPWMTNRKGFYDEHFADRPTNFAEAYETVQKAEALFDQLPLEFRREIDHDPRNIDKAPRELLERFGLLKKAPAPQEPTVGEKGASEPPTARRETSKKAAPAADKGEE